MSTRASGNRGNGGLCLHTILREGNRVHLGISTGGHYLSEDGGETFAAANKGVGAGSRRTHSLSSASASTKIAGHKDAPGRFTVRTTAAGPNGKGRREAAGHRRLAQRRPWPHLALHRKGLPSDFGSRLSCIRTTPTRSTSWPLEPMTRTCPGGVPAALAQRKTAAARGKETGAGAAQEREFLHRPARWRWTSTNWLRRHSILARLPANLWLRPATAERSGIVCLDHFPPIHCVKVAVV